MTKKELREKFNQQEQIGGVFAIKNSLNGKWYVDCVANIKAAENRFAFLGISFGKIAADYSAQNGEGFSFDVLEELKRGEAQSDEEFAKDLAMLKSMWIERLSGQDLY